MTRRVRVLARYLVEDAIGVLKDYSYAVRRCIRGKAFKRRLRR
jgi:hypothetical protein